MIQVNSHIGGSYEDMDSSKLAYICFDVVPAPKGASTHIEAFAKALASHKGSLTLVTVSPTSEQIDKDEMWPGIAQVALPALGKTLIDRVLYFRQQLVQWLQGQWFDTIQIRSIYEGFPIALHKSQWCRALIFEVNGLPSIELKYRYPTVVDDREFMQKLLAQEQQCLAVADLVVTPSHVTQSYLTHRGVNPNKIQVIPNGVDLNLFTYQAPRIDTDLTPLRWLYFGTLSAWQGVGTAIEALGLYCRDFPAELTIVGVARPPQVEALRKLTLKLDVESFVHIHEPVSQHQLVDWMHQADAIVAPLTPNDRNLVQGCCPLKVLEGMASGTPVITSDLPVIREIGEPDRHFLAVKPGSAKAIKDAMLQLHQSVELRQTLSRQARDRVEHYYHWDRAGADLMAAYRTL